MENENGKLKRRMGNENEECKWGVRVENENENGGLGGRPQDKVVLVVLKKGFQDHLKGCLEDIKTT